MMAAWLWVCALGQRAKLLCTIHNLTKPYVGGLSHWPAVPYGRHISGMSALPTSGVFKKCQAQTTYSATPALRVVQAALPCPGHGLTQAPECFQVRRILPDYLRPP